MSNTCQFVLDGDSKCGGPLATGSQKLCQLHDFSEADAVSDASIVNTYILQHQTEKILNLSRVKFKSIIFAFVKLPLDISISFVSSSFIDCKFFQIHFDNGIDFTGSTFENCGFTQLDFYSPPAFVNCRFIDTGFEDTQFFAGAIFSMAQFDGNVIPFHKCSFHTDDKSKERDRSTLSFAQTVFEGTPMPFPMCSISGNRVSFNRAVFKSISLNLYIHSMSDDLRISHYLAISSKEIDFSNLIFNGHFEYMQIPGFGSHLPTVDFQGVIFPQMKSVVFIEANLSKTIFTYSVIENIHFISCKWDRKPKKTGRQISYDHASRSDDIGMTEILRQYIQLKKNFENQKDFVGAGDWSYREMECRAELEERHSFRIAFWLYKKLAHYGESFTAPFFWLFLSCPIFGLFYLFSGIPVRLDGRKINYELFQLGPLQFGDIWHAIKFSGVAMSLQLGKSVDMMKWDGIWIYIPHLILTFTLVSLFLLALRRKFRR